MIKAVVFDLDDTLFPESDYVKSGYRAVAREIQKRYGLDGAETELIELFNSDRTNVFDHYLERHEIAVSDRTVGELVEIYRAHKPDISLSEGVSHTLEVLRGKGYKLGIITDGRPDGQRKKIDSLGLSGLVDKIIITDELGDEYRKPNPKAFELIAAHFGVSFEEMLYVGDNPKKDFAIGKYGVKTVRLISNGIYSDCGYLDGYEENKTISHISELIDEIDNYFGENYQSIIREKLLNIMDFIHEICNKENIQYSLGYGSLLGAIRHKGFIPWDDDMDVLMTRDNYNRFSEALKKYSGETTEFELARKVLKVPCVRYKQAPIVNSRRYDGIQIDIFIFDNYPDEILKQKKLIFRLKVLQGMMHKEKINWSKYSFKGKVLLFGTKVLGVFRTKESLIRAYDRLSSKYSNALTKTKFVSNASFAYIQKQYGNELLEKTIPAQFEDRTYNIYSEYESLLQIWYGDYMTLPPVEQRIPQHDIVVTEV